MFRTVLLASVIIAQSVSGCLDNFRGAIPTTPGETTLSGLGGSWGSLAVSAAEAVCTDFRWAVTDVELTRVSGTWSATCFKVVPVTGTASGALVEDEIRWTATGTGTAEGVGTCPVALTGTAKLENAQVRIPYTGTTCLGPVSGVELLRK